MEITYEYHSIPAMAYELLNRYEAKPIVRYFGTAGWSEMSGRQLLDRLENFACGLMQLGVERGDRIGVMAANAPEWLLADLAISSIGGITVPIYRTLDDTSVRFVINDAKLRTLVIDGEIAERRGSLLSNTLQELPAPLPLLVFNHASTSLPLEEERWLSLPSLEAQGEQVTDREAFFGRLAEIDTHDLFTIIYTSGTTGLPKGVMLSHQNLLSNIAASHYQLDIRAGEEVYLSYLPLAHAFERHCHYALLAKGGTLVYGRGFDQLAEDLIAVAPTIIIAVPRVFEKFHGRVIQKVEESAALRRRLFRWAVEEGGQHFATGTRSLMTKFAERLVLNKIKVRMGRRLRYAVSGGGPLNPELAQFFNAVGIRVVEGYGLTETSPVIACNPVEAIRIGSVGPVYANLESRLTDGGELMVRGPSVMQGYYQQPEATDAVLSEDGWLHTGDLAAFDADGYLTITGRLKEILITASGKNVAPRRVEERFLREPWCEQICLVGDGKPFLVALIVVDPGAVQRRLGRATDDASELRLCIQDQSYWQALEQWVATANGDLASFETVKRFALLDAPFCEEAGTLTPTQKPKRHAIVELYGDVLEALYADTATVVRGAIPVLPRDFSQPQAISDQSS